MRSSGLALVCSYQKLRRRTRIIIIEGVQVRENRGDSTWRGRVERDKEEAESTE